VPFRIKKWWFPFYTWSLSVSAVNAWRLRMKTTGKKEAYLDFLRELCIEMLSVHGTPPTCKKRPSSAAGDTLRFDIFLYRRILIFALLLYTCCLSGF
jgi:hypothetical protein